MRDYQAKQLYRMESRFLKKYCIPFSNFNEAQGFVDFVWADMGLQNPPKITHDGMIGRNAGRGKNGIIARANRQFLFFNEKHPKLCNYVVVIHEMMHSFQEYKSIMTYNERYMDGHGPYFMKFYINALNKYLNIPTPMLLYFCKECKLDAEGYLKN